MRSSIFLVLRCAGQKIYVNNEVDETNFSLLGNKLLGVAEFAFRVVFMVLRLT